MLVAAETVPGVTEAVCLLSNVLGYACQQHAECCRAGKETPQHVSAVQSSRLACLWSAAVCFVMCIALVAPDTVMLHRHRCKPLETRHCVEI